MLTITREQLAPLDKETLEMMVVDMATALNKTEANGDNRNNADGIVDLLSREKDPTFTQCIYLSMVFHGWLPDFENRRWVATCCLGSALSHSCEILDSYDIDSRDATGDLATGAGTSVFDLALHAWGKIRKEDPPDAS